MGSDTTAPAPPHLGNFDIVSKIADGGMGTVYKAKNRFSGQIVAIKVIAPTTAKNPILLKRFQQEFEAAKLLDHPNVVRALEYHGMGPNPFLVMEFVDGESFGQRIERAGAFPEAEAIRLIAQVCEGLQRAHKQGLVHRDVKPDNILVTRDGVAKLTDMGLVKDVEGDLNLTKTGRGLGTPHFMAPEQFRNAKMVDVRGDIYSLGATLYAMVSGQTPFENASPLDCWMKKIRNEFPPPKELNPAVSDRVDWAIRRAMSAEPDRRPSSCREFLEDLTGQSRTTPTRFGEHAGRAAVPTDIWYMVYKDETGAAHTVKGTTDGIRNALSNHLLGDAATVLVSRTKTGHFQSLASVPEFRDLVVHPAQVPVTSGTRLSGVLSKTSGVSPTAAERRRPTDAEAVDLGASPSPSGTVSASGSRRGQPTPRSARYATPPVPTSSTTTTPPLVTLTVEHPADPQAQTEPFAEPIDSKLELPSPASPAPATSTEIVHKREPINWNPILMGVILVLATVVLTLLIRR